MLIRDTDPEPFSIVNENGKAPVILICDHASNQFPENAECLGLTPAQIQDHVAWDIGAADVAEYMAEHLDATLVLCGYSRLLIDCNRPVDDVGSIVPTSDNVLVPGNQELTAAERQERVANFFTPYHSAIDRVIEGKIKAGITPRVMSIHSFTPLTKKERRKRPWHFCIMSEEDRRLADPLIENLRLMNVGLIGDNEPYAGKDVGYSLRIHAGEKSLENVGIEIRQDLIDDPGKAKKYAHQLITALK